MALTSDMVPASDLREIANSCSKELEEFYNLAAEMRALLQDDASDLMLGAMVGSPLDCFYFAKLWIQRTKGMTPDDRGYFKEATP